MKEVSLWANNNNMAWIMKMVKRLQEAINFRRPFSRAPPLGEQFLDEAHAAREELLAEIQRSAETDVGARTCQKPAGRRRDECTQRNPTGTSHHVVFATKTGKKSRLKAPDGRKKGAAAGGVVLQAWGGV